MFWCGIPVPYSLKHFAVWCGLIMNKTVKGSHSHHSWLQSWVLPLEQKTNDRLKDKTFVSSKECTNVSIYGDGSCKNGLLQIRNMLGLPS